MEIKVEKNFIRTSPDKIRLIIDLVRNKNLIESIHQLRFVGKDASKPVLELLKSGLDAAKDKNTEEEKLYIKEIYCDEGPRLKRRRIIHKGRATAINKRMSHINLVISDERRINGSKS